MTIASELITLLGFSIEGESNLRKYKRQQQSIERDTTAHVGRMNKIGGISTGVLAGGALAVAAAGKRAYDAWLPVELRLARIALNSGKSTKEVPGMFARISELAQRFGTTTDIVTAGLENLVAKGADVEDAFSTLPDILTTTQGFGVEIGDAADTAYKLRDAFRLTKEEAQQLSDVLGASGQAGQFEYKDFAQFAPGLSNLYAAVSGSTGITGVKELTAIAQMHREDTATSGEAATGIENWLSKAYAEQTQKAFKEHGINLRKSMKKRLDAGQDFFSAYMDITDKAIGGDVGRVGELFPDMQAQTFVRSGLTSRDRYAHYRAVVDDPDVAGTATRNVNAVLDLQITKVEKLTEKWNSLWVTLGAKISGPVGGGLDAIINQINDPADLESGLRKRGYSGAGLFAKQFFMTPMEMKEIIAEERALRSGKPLPPKDAAGGDSMVKRKYVMPAKPTASVVPAGRDFTAESPMSTITKMIAGMDAHLAKMTGDAPVNAAITDSRTDNRNQSVNVTSSVVQNISQPTAAPGAVGSATNAAVSGAVQQAARIQQEPAQ